MAQCIGSVVRPSAEELQHITDMRTLLEWAGMSGEAPIQTDLEEFTGDFMPQMISDVQSFLAWTKMSPSTHFRLLAMMNATDFQTAMWEGWKVNGEAPSFGARMSAILAHSTARCICRMEPWPDELVDAQVLASQTAAAQPATPKSAAPAPGPPGMGGASALIDLGLHLDMKMITSQIAYLPSEEIQAFKMRYFSVMDRFPTPQTATTPEQLAGLNFVLNTVKRAPYADFAVFGPFAVRSTKRHKLHGTRFDASGRTVPVELYGPANHDI